MVIWKLEKVVSDAITDSPPANVDLGAETDFFRVHKLKNAGK
jgi:hypothetical protein